MSEISDVVINDSLFQRDQQETYPVMVRGEGIYLYDEAGKRYIDGIAGAGNVTLGHGNQRIVNAMSEQACKLAYCFSTHFSNQPAQELAERVAALAPGDLNHVYFVSGGSEANETAIKLARQYHIQQGNGQKQLIISRWRSYHGASLGALSLTGVPSMRAPFEPWLPPFPKIAPCYPYRCRFAGCDGHCNLSCANDLERTIVEAGPENVAAFIAEPVVLAGHAAGTPATDYFRTIRDICDKYNVLFIADEVITGWGRTGKYFAIEHANVVPDLITFAKGISSGYSPLGGVIMDAKIKDSFTEAGSSFAHVFTYVNNPVSMRVGLEVLDILEDENILGHVVEMGHYLINQARELDDYEIVGEIRGLGLILGIELVMTKKTKEPFPESQGVYKRLRQITLDRGLSVMTSGGMLDWVRGDDLRFYPPLTINRNEIDDCVAILDASLGQLQEEIL